MTKSKAATATPDATGWTKGTPTAEGAFWFCTKDNKYKAWRIYLGTTFAAEGKFFHDIAGYGMTRTEEFKHVYHQSASLPELPVAVLKKKSAKNS